MENYILAGIAALAVIGIANIIVTAVCSSKRRSDDIADRIEEQFEQQLDEIEKQERVSRKELSESLNSSVKLLSDILTQNQKLMSDSTLSQLKQLEERFKTLETTNEQKLDEMRGTISQRLGTIQEDNNKRLEEIRVTVDEKLQKTLDEKMSQSFKRVSESLEEVYKGLGEMKNLAADVGGLKRVLSNVKARGIMGEIQLGAILQEILAPEQYDTNVVTIPGSANRVEFAVKLPGDDGGNIYLPIDSKFPADCYTQLQDAQESGSREAVEAALSLLTARIKSFAKDIHDKYIEPPYTTTFGIMFLPFEGLYSEVVSHGLVEILQREYNVNIAGPSTMAALLNSLQMGFKTLAIQKRSNEVWQILSAVKSEFGKFEEVLENAQRHITQVGTDIDKLVGARTRAINRRLRDVQSLDTSSEAEKLLDLENQDDDA